MNYSAVSDQTLLGKALRLPLRLIPQNTHIRVLQGRLRGKRWIVGSSTHGCWLGSYEYAKQQAFSEAIQRGNVVYDVGANVGFYSLLASVLVGPRGHVFSFEPVQRNLQFLKRHLELNEVTNCSVLDVAVSRNEGTAQFALGPNASMGRLMNESKDGLTVRTVALNTLVASGELPPPDVIKCDVEGAEFDALSGASEILTKHRPTIFLATHGVEVHKSCCRLLDTLGYHLGTLDGLPISQSTEILAARLA
jgi:FkbM family methyltransferase